MGHLANIFFWKKGMKKIEFLKAFNSKNDQYEKLNNFYIDHICPSLLHCLYFYTSTLLYCILGFNFLYAKPIYYKPVPALFTEFSWKMTELDHIKRIFNRKLHLLIRFFPIEQTRQGLSYILSTLEILPGARNWLIFSSILRCELSFASKKTANL